MEVHESDQVNGSDSDSDLDEAAQEYYEPISAVDDEEFDQISDGESHALPNGVASLCLSDNKLSSDDEEEEVEARARDDTDSAATRALGEDEARRNAPLAPENAMRVMEAMRGISFEGVAPAWAGSVAESDWIGRLRRLRQPPPS